MSYNLFYFKITLLNQGKSENILKQLIAQVISAKTFSIQIDESVDVQNNYV